MWDPAQYALFGTHRARPFADLVARVAATAPRLVVDVGCGDGTSTLTLTERWPGARVVGLDSSPDMLAAARANDLDGRVEWVEACAEDWGPADLGAPIDVLLTNAALQWIPGHLDLLPRWAAALAPGGWFAMQVPDNLDSPSHRLMRRVAVRHRRYADLLPRLDRALAVAAPGEYLATLSRLGLEADVWETTYHHVLDPDGVHTSPVLEWMRATGLRPVLAVLADDAEREEFLADYAAELARAYPREPWGVVLPFARLFAVGRRPA